MEIICKLRVLFSKWFAVYAPITFTVGIMEGLIIGGIKTCSDLCLTAIDMLSL